MTMASVGTGAVIVVAVVVVAFGLRLWSGRAPYSRGSIFCRRLARRSRLAGMFDSRLELGSRLEKGVQYMDRKHLHQMLGVVTWTEEADCRSTNELFIRLKLVAA